MTHVSGPGGAKDEPGYEEAYWRAFNRFFGPQNGPVVKAMLLAKFPPGDAGMTEIERVAHGLKLTMGWVAEAVERTAHAEVSNPAESPKEDRAPRARR